MTRVFEIPMYNCFVGLFYKEEADEKINVPKYVISECGIIDDTHKELLDYSNDSQYLFQCYSVNGLHVIEINKDGITDDKDLFKVICHESYHCACAILDRIGVKYSKEKSEEVFAYLTDHIAGEVYETLEKEFEYFIIKRNQNKELE